MAPLGSLVGPGVRGPKSWGSLNGNLFRVILPLIPFYPSGGFLSDGGTPSHHPNFSGILYEINHPPTLGYPHDELEPPKIAGWFLSRSPKWGFPVLRLMLVPYVFQKKDGFSWTTQ